MNGKAWKRSVSLGCCGFGLMVGFAVGQTREYPHDPNLLRKIQSGAFDEIARGKVTAVGLNAISQGFLNTGCTMQDPSFKGSAREVMHLTQALSSEMQEGALLQWLVATHPNYQQTVVLASQAGCNSRAVQQSMRNFVIYLRKRYPDAARMR